MGVAGIDLVQLVDSYPRENDELRARAQFTWRGGNATNSLVVLSQLGHSCSWLGTLADDELARVICSDLDNYHIDYSHCPRHGNTTTPTSHITLSALSASRTIVHYRDLPELALAECQQLDLSAYDWLHAEGRNTGVTHAFLQHVRQHYPALPVSIEIEKPRDDIETLIPLADYVLFSKQYAQSQGHDSADALLAALADKQQNRVHVCAWGELGAWCRTAAGELLHSPAMTVERAVDTRAAGDVFNAAWIDAMLNGLSPEGCLQQACALAGRKCARLGLGDLLT
jgi:ketohexokinase